MKLLLAIVILPFMLFIGTQDVANAKILGPGTCGGYFYVDRWGQNVFYAGPDHLFVSDDVANKLKPYTGNKLLVDVAEMYQLNNPGGGVIYGFSKITVVKSPRLTIEARFLSSRVAEKQGLTMNIRIRNDTKNEVQLGPGSPCNVVLVTQKPYSNDAIGYPGEDSFWFYQTSVFPRNSTNLLRTACRLIELPWSAEEYIKHSDGVTMGDKKSTLAPPGVYKPLFIKSGGWCAFDVTVGKELLVGQYEVFVFYGGDYGQDYDGPMSKRIPFDVIAADKR